MLDIRTRNKLLVSEDVMIRRVKKGDFEQFFKLIVEGFKREVDIVGLDIRRFKHIAKFYGVATVFLPLLDFLNIDFETILVAVAQNRIVGEIHLVPHGKRIWSIDSATTDKNFRGRGIFRKLMKEALRYASKRHGERVITSMWMDNIATIKITRELGYTLFAKETLLVGELSKTHCVQSNENLLIREIKRPDVEQVYPIFRRFNPKRTQAYGITHDDIVDSVFERFRNKFALTNSRRLVMETRGKIVGYAHATYTSAREACNLELFCTLPSVDPLGLVGSLLGYMSSLLAVRNIKKVVVNIDEDHTETIAAFQHFGFKPIASIYKVVKELR